MSRRRVLLAEDNPLMQDVVVALLCREFQVIEVVGRGDEILARASQTEPDALVLDISLRGRSGLQVLPELRRQRPLLAVVMLTNHADPLYREEAFRRGADAFVLKSNAVGELLPAVHRAIANRSIRSHVSRRPA